MFHHVRFDLNYSMNKDDSLNNIAVAAVYARTCVCMCFSLIKKQIPIGERTNL